MISFCSLHIFFFNILISVTLSNVRFTAITSTHWSYIHKLYLEEGNENPPSEFDSVTTNTSVKMQICKDIGHSNLIQFQNPENVIGVHGYVQRQFEVTRYFPLALEAVSVFKKEYVLICWQKRRKIAGSYPFYLSKSELHPFYVSKAYGENRGLHVHRFVFLREEDMEETTEGSQKIMLAEGPAQDYRRQDFNIELHYLELKKRYHTAEENRNLDPVCKLNSVGLRDDADLRLCSIVMNSSYFKNYVLYAQSLLSKFCHRRRVRYRTQEGLEEAPGELYSELMICCYAKKIEGEELEEIYISRAYNPNQVFVYVTKLDSTGQMKTYLENLSINVGIVHERYNFGDVEI